MYNLTINHFSENKKNCILLCYRESTKPIVTFGEDYRFIGNLLRITFEAKPRNRYKILMEELVIIITFVTMLNKIQQFVDSDINKYL